MTKVNFNSVPIASGHFSGIYHLFFFEKLANAPRMCQQRIHTKLVFASFPIFGRTLKKDVLTEQKVYYNKRQENKRLFQKCYFIT